MKNKLIGIIICMLLIGTVLPVSGTLIIDTTTSSNVYGNTLYVGGTGEGNYTSIQDAIDNSSDGDTVFVYDYSSPYYENVVVNKSIFLIGEDKDTTVIDGSWNEIVVSVSADGVTVSEFTIRNGTCGIDIRSNSNTITDNIISNNETGMGIGNSHNNTITGNNIISNKFFGIIVYESSSNTITGNTISNNEYYGIYLYYSKSNTITNNIISNNKDGIYLAGYIDEGFDFIKIFYDGSNNNIILKNNFLGNERDAFFQNSFRNNQWKQNYWNKPQILPKLIRGEIYFYEVYPLWIRDFHFPWFPQIDWRPALEPYDI